MEVKQKAALIYNAIEDKKGSRISVLDIRVFLLWQIIL